MVEGFKLHTEAIGLIVSTCQVLCRLISEFEGERRVSGFWGVLEHKGFERGWG